jgi:hypothetical protein
MTLAADLSATLRAKATFCPALSAKEKIALTRSVKISPALFRPGCARTKTRLLIR